MNLEIYYSVQILSIQVMNKKKNNIAWFNLRPVLHCEDLHMLQIGK